MTDLYLPASIRRRRPSRSSALHRRFDAAPIADDRSPEHLTDLACAEHREQVAPARAQCACATRHRGPADCVEDDVVGVRAVEHVVDRVVDHLIGAQGSHQRQVRRAAHARHVGSRACRELHRRGPDRPGGAVDEHPLTPSDPALVPQEDQSGQRAVGYRRGLLVRHGGRHGRQDTTLSDAGVLGIGAEPQARVAEDPLPRAEPTDLASHRLDLPRQFESQDGLARPAEAEQQARRDS